MASGGVLVMRPRYGRGARTPSAAGRKAVSPRADDESARTGYFRHMLRRRADVLLALLLAVPSVVQAVVWPIAAMPVSVLIALCSTLPIAWRRTHPIVATLIGTAVWFIPTDGYIVTGYIAAFILYYSLAAHVEDVEPVAAVTAFGVAVSITGSWINGEVAGEYFGAVSAVLLPAVAGRVVRRQ